VLLMKAEVTATAITLTAETPFDGITLAALERRHTDGVYTHMSLSLSVDGVKLTIQVNVKADE
jgi:hypothetical protein